MQHLNITNEQKEEIERGWFRTHYFFKDGVSKRRGSICLMSGACVDPFLMKRHERICCIPCDFFH